ncbi:MAG: ABC transporter ATP-binding protein [Phycisphaerales bacterium]
MTGPPAHPRARWRRLLQLGRPRWRGYVLIWALTLVSSGVALLQPWPVKVLVDHILGSQPPPAWAAGAVAAGPGAAVALVAAATLLLFVLDALVDVALTLSWVRVAQRSVYDLAAATFARLQRRSIAFHAVTPVGDSLSRITGDSWCIYNAATALLFAPLHALLVGGAMVAVLLRMSPTLTAVALAAAPLLAVTSVILGRRAERARGAERQIESRIESHIQQTLTGIRVVQTFAQEDRTHGRFRELAGTAILAHRRSAIVAALSSGSAGILTTLGTGAVLGLGAWEVIGGRLTLGALLVFLAYLATLNAQLVALATAYTTARGLSASIDRALVALDAPEEVPQLTSAPPLAIAPAGGSVVFENVRFGYLPGRPVLDGVSLDIPAGATVAVVGASGAGKTTLALLVPRLLDPWSGRILISGTDTRLVGLASLRRQVAVVLQEPMLLAGTIAANIALGRPDAAREEVARAAGDAGLAALLASLPAGLDTVIGEGGATLSGGEKQRIAIARALLKDAPILILDEPTSALDAATESGILRALDRLRRGRTTLVIAHRLSTIRSADLVAVLHGGAIAELGAHDELLRRDGHYARLWRLHAAPPLLQEATA